MRIRDGIPLRINDMIRFEKAVTTVTDKAMTKAGFSLAVTASAEQMPNICTVIGLFCPKGEVSSFRFLAEKSGSRSWLLMAFRIFG